MQYKDNESVGHCIRGNQCDRVPERHLSMGRSYASTSFLLTKHKNIYWFSSKIPNPFHGAFLRSPHICNAFGERKNMRHCGMPYTCRPRNIFGIEGFPSRFCHEFEAGFDTSIFRVWMIFAGIEH